jgi:four helix bundle protein
LVIRSGYIVGDKSVADKITSVKDLDIFKLSHKTALNIYKITSSFPKDELFGLSSQMRRVAVSLNSNLAEGAGRTTSGDFKQFIRIARGSAAELEYQRELAGELDFIDANKTKEIR